MKTILFQGWIKDGVVSLKTTTEDQSSTPIHVEVSEEDLSYIQEAFTH